MDRPIAILSAALALATAGCASEEARLSRVQTGYYERLRRNEQIVERERARYDGLQAELIARDRARQLEVQALRAERDALRRALERVLQAVRAPGPPAATLRRAAEAAAAGKEEADRVREAGRRRRATAVGR